MKNQYATEEETKALLARNRKPLAERLLDKMLEERWADEQGVDIESRYLILYRIAVELIEEKMK